MRRHPVFLDRARDGGLPICRLDKAYKLCRSALDLVNGPRVTFLGIPECHQSAALICWKPIFLDRARDGSFLVRCLDNANQPRRPAFLVVDGPTINVLEVSALVRW